LLAEPEAGRYAGRQDADVAPQRPGAARRTVEGFQRRGRAAQSRSQPTHLHTSVYTSIDLPDQEILHFSAGDETIAQQNQILQSRNRAACPARLINV
jgi:hypothetical protein